MAFFKQLQYFFYLASNWNLRLALYVVRHEITGEKKYGIRSTGADELKSLARQGVDTSHATLYMPVVYPVLEDLMRQLPGNARPHFADIGCGKGRALCVAAHFGFTRLTGIDFSKEFCEASRENLAITAQRLPGLQYDIIHDDALYFEIPLTVSCIFLFNPFDEVIMTGVVRNIEKSLARKPRPLYVIYANPVLQHVFTEAGFKQLYYIQKLDYLEAVILQYEPQKA